MIEASTLLAILLLAHVLLDFWVSSYWTIETSASRKQKVVFHLVTFGVYFVVFSLLMILSRENGAFAWKAGLMMSTAKLLTLIQTPTSFKSPIWALLARQTVLIASLVTIWLLSESNAAHIQGSLAELITTANITIGLAYVLMLRPASALIGTILNPWIKEIDTGGSLTNAGTLIGYLERILILTFVLLEQWEAVGFLLTAKSILRFNEIQNAKVRSISEYVLLGTLLSFTLSIGTGLLVAYITR
ncbi:hypothetical protein [Pseudomonas sp. FP198]|uniref:hypothetical protein n=1 Tax=Pseudomonas sp. FP198 TaxID=2954084 RepID=UPI002736DCD6|nr:hypothetical protein [Pseudomonas sp. FP198]WLG94962.1 hypothetical protein PSH78_21735 [Pseudomonas sp. FP198]